MATPDHPSSDRAVAPTFAETLFRAATYAVVGLACAVDGVILLGGICGIGLTILLIQIEAGGEPFTLFLRVVGISLAAVAAGSALLLPREKRGATCLGWAGLPLFVAVAFWIWNDHFSQGTRVMPPPELWSLLNAALLNGLALALHRPLRPASPRSDEAIVSLGTTAALVALTAVLGLRAWRISEQLPAAEELRRLGGGVYWDNGYATKVSFARRTEDADLVYLDGLPRLKTVHLSNSRVTDAGLLHLAGHRDLESLDLGETAVTDRGLAHIAGLTQLRNLDLSNTRVTDAGLVYLRGMTEMGYLDLRETAVTDAGLPHLTHMRRMGYLGLYGTAVTDSGLQDRMPPGFSSYNGHLAVDR